MPRPHSITAVLIAASTLAPTTVRDARAERSFPPDRTAPGMVTDLIVGPCPAGYVTLAWTAVGDDGPACAQCSANGTPVTSYDLRYSTVAPGGDVNAWFNGATQATGEPSPAGCGCRDGLCIPGLTPGRTYYFGLRALDEARNASPVSNIVSAQPGTATGDMHISNVVSSWFYAGGVKKRGQAFVTIVDQLGQPVPCATVTVQWTGCYADTASAVTDVMGTARVVSNRVANCSNGQCCFIVAVTDVTHTAYVHDSGADLMTLDTASCNLFEPTDCPPIPGGDGCGADLNHDGALDSRDLLEFLRLFGTGAPESDFNGDGLSDSQDLVDYLEDYLVGCS